MNKYNTYYVGAIIISLGFVISGSPFSATALAMLGLGFVAGSLALFFLPLVKPDDEHDVTRVKAYWMFKVAVTQGTVVFSVFGISNVIVSRIGQLGGLMRPGRFRH